MTAITAYIRTTACHWCRLRTFRARLLARAGGAA